MIFMLNFPLVIPSRSTPIINPPLQHSIFFFCCCCCCLVTHAVQFVRPTSPACEAISWSTVDLPGATPLKKTETPFPRSHSHLQVGTETYEFLPIR